MGEKKANLSRRFLLNMAQGWRAAGDETKAQECEQRAALKLVDADTAESYDPAEAGANG